MLLAAYLSVLLGGSLHASSNGVSGLPRGAISRSSGIAAGIGNHGSTRISPRPMRSLADRKARIPFDPVAAPAPLKMNAVVERQVDAEVTSTASPIAQRTEETEDGAQQDGWVPTVPLIYPLLLVTSEGALISEREVAKNLGRSYAKMVREVRYLQGRGLVVDFRNEEARESCMQKWSQPDAFEGLAQTEMYKMEGGRGMMPGPVARALNASRCQEKTTEFLTQDEDGDFGADAKAFFTYTYPLILESQQYCPNAVQEVRMAMGREFEALVKNCQWLRGRGLVLDFKINAARKRWATFWTQRPVGFENRAWIIKRFYRYPLILESKHISGNTPLLTPSEFKDKIQDILGDDWKKRLTKNTHFFNNKQTGEIRGLILDFNKADAREKWKRKLSQRNLGFPLKLRDFKWYTDDMPSSVEKRQTQLSRPGAVESLSTNRIFIGNLNKTTSAVDLVIYFSQFGSVKDATIMANKKTGKSRGFGFVTFQKDKTVEKVMQQYHQLMGQNLAVQKALSEEDVAIIGEAPSAQIQQEYDATPSRIIKVEQVPSGANDQILTEYFKGFGPIASVSMETDGAAHVSFTSDRAVERVLNRVNHMIEVPAGDGETGAYTRRLNVAKVLSPEDSLKKGGQPVLSIEGDAVQQVIEAAKKAGATVASEVSSAVEEGYDRELAKHFRDDMESLVPPLSPAASEALSGQGAQQEDKQEVEKLAGDYNIDLFNVKKDPQLLRRMRLAEIKHARLAMLAAAAWPLQELFDPAIANLLHVAPLVTDGGRTPSLLNGGLQQISPLFWSTILGATITIEYLYGDRGLKGEIRIENADMLARGEAGRAVYTKVSPGDLGFDPLGLYPDDQQGQERAKTGEINNGRLAMIALATFVLAEYITGESIVDLTPQFFTPLGS